MPADPVDRRLGRAREAPESTLDGESGAGASGPPTSRVPSRPQLTRRSVLAAAAAGLAVGLGGCVAPAAPPGPTAGTASTAASGGAAQPAAGEPRSAPSRAYYLRSLVVQRAEAPQDTKIPIDAWRLRVGGLVAKPLELTYEDLASYPTAAQPSALHCVEGWSVADLAWEGIRLATLLDAVEPDPTARWVTFDTFAGTYRDSLSLEQARLDDVLLAYRLAGAPLTEDLGYPLRLVVPRMYGYKSVKWLARITLSRERDEGYWEARGYPADAWLG